MIYENLTVRKFRSLKSRLVKIEDSIDKECWDRGYQIDKLKFYDETLAININRHKKNIVVYEIMLITINGFQDIF